MWEQDTIMKSKFLKIFFDGSLYETRVLFYTARFCTRGVCAARFCIRGLCTGIMSCPYAKSIKEQAEAGQWPCFACICAANGVLRILRGYFRAFLPMREKKTGYFGVSYISA